MSVVRVFDSLFLVDIWNDLTEYKEIFYGTIRMLSVIALTFFMNWSSGVFVDEPCDKEDPEGQGSTDGSTDGAPDGSGDGAAEGVAGGVADSAVEGAAQPAAQNNNNGNRNRRRRT